MVNELGSTKRTPTNGETRPSFSMIVGIAVAGLTLVQFWMSFSVLTGPWIVTEDIDTRPSSVQESTTSNINSPDYYDYFINITTPQPQPTLVHFDPVFLGGFRNQHMRFVALVNFAVEHSIKQILLPSIRWSSDQSNPNPNPSPHEYLFDVPYWNEHAEEFGLPRLVRYDRYILEGIQKTEMMDDNTTIIACFNTSSGLYSGLDEQLLRDPSTNLRRVSIYEKIGSMNGYSHCKRSHAKSVVHGSRFTYLVPHGGSQGKGKLWTSYNAMQKQRYANTTEIKIGNENVTIYPDHPAVEKAIYSILRPTETIRNAIKGAIQLSAGTGDENGPVQFVALHPRIEHDMLAHRCGTFMQKNLTKIFQHLRALSPFDLLFIAVNRESALSTETPARWTRKSQHLVKFALENANVLNHSLAYGVFGNKSHTGIPIFEAGIQTARKILFPERPITAHKTGTVPHLVSADELKITQIVASIVNFFTGLEAEQFVGVKGSSYSTDLFSARHYMGKGGSYIMDSDGMREMIGPPPPHKC